MTPDIRRAFADAFDIERELGRGGMGYVFLATDRARGQRVALKVLRPELTTSVTESRFMQEIEIVGRLQHANILSLIASGSLGGFLYYTMPFVEGETLRDRLEREPQLRVPDVLAIAADVAQAIDAANAVGVIHRDVKPANVLLKDGRAVVADFGIARAITEASGEQITDSGVVLGTPEYMSPEQGTGQRTIDGRSDVYALGCVVYHMLAGEPPFGGRNPQAIIARHCHERPPSLRVVRPALTKALEGAVEKALAKVPADRFTTAGEFVEELTRAAARPDEPEPGSVWRRLAVGAGALAVAVAGWMALGPKPALASDRIVVFPLRAASPTDAAGDEVATYIGYALEGTQPLKWLEGWDYLDARARGDLGRLTRRRSAEVARKAGAGHFIDGSIVRGPDSVTVLLRLYSVAGDSMIAQAGASGALASAFLPKLGLQAIATLLPSLLAPGRRVDLSALADRHPTAIANFLQGERESRRMHFAAALDHYRAAVKADSALALAALRGAEAANWLSRFGEDTALSSVALRQEGLLPRRLAALARGLHAYLTGNADSAVASLRLAIALDSSSSAAWTVLGETYLRLIPDVESADSLAIASLERVRRTDPDFAPALLLLEEDALTRRDLPRVLRLREELRLAGADTSHRVERDLMLRCVRDGAAAVDWSREARRAPHSVLAVGKLFSARAAVPSCARAALDALIRVDTAVDNRWVALLALQSLLVATGRMEEIPPLLASPKVSDIPTWPLYLMDNAAGAGFDDEARAAARANSSDLRRASTARLWLLGSWRAASGDRAGTGAIARIVMARADSTQQRVDRLVARGLRARVALLDGDTASALTQLLGLKADGRRNDLAWQPWEALAGERFLLAELLLRHGQLAAAERAASGFDAGEPVIHLLYLRPSLELRIRIAAAAKNARCEGEYRRRLAALQGP
ncbi:MAG: serine/threonine-protein kinase [Gemmatimonadota bacterium]